MQGEVKLRRPIPTLDVQQRLSRLCTATNATPPVSSGTCIPTKYLPIANRLDFTQDDVFSKRVYPKIRFARSRSL